MDDRLIMENILTSTKSACNLMMNGALESSTLNVHNAFTQSLADSNTSAKDLMQTLLQGGSAGQ